MPAWIGSSFSFCCPAPSLAPRSFPTRRSSDLRDETGQVRAVAKILRDVTERKLVEEACRESEERLRVLDELALGNVDRKSTRLNSSHVRISYAVFCLKKKITAPSAQQTTLGPA